MDVRIDYLANHPALVPTLANWTYAEWGQYDPTNSLEATKARLTQRLNRDSLPLSLVAFADDVPAGCASLKLSEMTIRPQYSPWLGSMFVVPTLRGQGIGSALVRRVIDEARRLEVRELYLWTEGAVAFYRKREFEIIETVDYLGQKAMVMKMRIA